MNKLIPSFIMFSVLAACGGDSDVENTDDPVVNNTENDTASVEDKPYVVEIMLDKIENVPAKCEIKGKKVDVYTWKDKNGKNYFIRSMGDYTEIEPEDEYSDRMASQYLYAYHYAEDSEGNFTLLKETTDFVEDCEFDIVMGHELDAITLTDIDKDDMAEVTFIYRLACTSDVSPSTQKLIMLENGDKYPLRGSTQVMGEGGEYKVGEEYDSAPEGFLEHAKKLWSENLKEYDFEL
ncbi:MAG: hypothetical protein HUJ25_07210 [Crocinitomicaceae bacterium]|nr:hypothetical protein [Crocinitomicaceae bacterium]